MSFTYGYDENGNKIYFDSTSHKITMQQVIGDEPISEKLLPRTLQEDLAIIGFDQTEITNIMNKINKVGESSSAPTPVSTKDPTTGTTTTNVNGSLVSNSAQSLKNNTEYQKAKISIEQSKLSLMSAQNEIQKKQLDMMDYNLLMQGQVYEQIFELNKNIKAQTTAIENQKLTADVNVSPSVTIDTTALATATQTLASGVEDQKATNAKLVEKLDKQIEHFDFMKDGTTELKDSNGNQIKPREVEAKANAEKHIEQKDTNETTFDDIADFVSDALGVVEDGVEQVVGSTDGFDLNFNPFAFLDKILVHDYQNHKDNYPANPNSTPPPTS